MTKLEAGKALVKEARRFLKTGNRFPMYDLAFDLMRRRILTLTEIEAILTPTYAYPGVVRMRRRDYLAYTPRKEGTR